MEGLPSPVSVGSGPGSPGTSQPQPNWQQPPLPRVAGNDQAISHKTGRNSCIEMTVVFFSMVIVVITFPFSLLFVFTVSEGKLYSFTCRSLSQKLCPVLPAPPVLVVRQFERGVMLRNGKLYRGRALGPGLLFRLPCIDELKFTDLRTICYTVPPQEALTKDSLTVSVDAVVFYRITDPLRAVINVSDYKSATHYLAATMLRNAIGTRKLTELLSNRPEVSYDVYTHMQAALLSWGITAVKVEIKDIRLPLQLQKAMAAEAESSRLANAKIIVAKAEIEATKSLEKATSMLMENPYSMQLRYLQSLHLISASDTHTIVIPAALFPKNT